MTIQTIIKTSGAIDLYTINPNNIKPTKKFRDAKSVQEDT